MNSPSLTGTEYPRMRLSLALIRLRQQARAACDATGLGPTLLGRACCALILGTVLFAGSFILSFALRDPPGNAVLQAAGVFSIGFVPAMLLIPGATDEQL